VKKILTLLPFLVIGSMLVAIVGAVTLTPSSGTYAPGSITKINLAALLPIGAPEDSIDGIVIDLSVSGGTVTGYVPPNDPSVDATGNCPDDEMYTSDSVCVLLGKNAGYFSNTDNLGFFNVQWGSAGTATITKTDNNIYIDTVNEDTYIDSGEGGTYNISLYTPTPSPTRTLTPTPSGRLPEAGIEDGGGPIFLGIVIFVFGIFLYKYSSTNYIFSNEK